MAEFSLLFFSLWSMSLVKKVKVMYSFGRTELNNKVLVMPNDIFIKSTFYAIHAIVSEIYDVTSF